MNPLARRIADLADRLTDGRFRRRWRQVRARLVGAGTSRTAGELDRIEKALIELDKNGLGLEIGPGHSPVAPRRNGFKVQIVDYLDQEGLREKFTGQGHPGAGPENIEAVDFVWRGQSLTDLIGKQACYDWIIASHVIEHVPDLVSLLQQCQALLKSSGRLSLIIPDQRYCFDHFISLSRTGDILDAYEQKRTRATPGQVFDYFAGTCTRGGAIAWSQELGGEFALVTPLEEAASRWRQASTGNDYIDIHCWRFTPDSFRLLIADLNRLGLIDLAIVREFDTAGCEFHVTLAPGRDPHPLDRLEALQKIAHGDLDA